MKVAWLVLVIIAICACIFLWHRPYAEDSIECYFISDTRSLKQNTENSLSLKIVNNTSRDLLLSGFGAACGENCCIGMNISFPQKIPARSDMIISLPVLIRDNQHYHMSTFIYLTDDGNIMQFPLTLSSSENNMNYVSHLKSGGN
jgi:hypothetical protein